MTRISALLGAAILVLAGCGEPDERKPSPPLGATTGGGGEGGTGAGGSGSGGSTSCGDGVVDEGEDCDGVELGGATCGTLSLPAGTLACAPSCTFDTSKCGGPEVCVDGLDNDGDGAVDCADTADCAAACAHTCDGAAVISATDPHTSIGDTSAHPDELDASCAAPGGGGSEIVYRVTAANTGVLAVTLTSDTNLGVSIRTACADAASELGCADVITGSGAVERIKLPITAGDTVYVVVQGYTKGDAGSYLLDVRSRPIVCGDGHADADEVCDDGNLQDGDGCSAACALEATEVEPNGLPLVANAFTAPWYAALTPSGDVDLVKVEVKGASSTLTATVGDLDGTSCQTGFVDSYLEILAPNGLTVLAAGDDELGACSVAQAEGLAAGTYYVRVSASPLAIDPTFAYTLAVGVVADVCGDGTITAGEQCDDGNTVGGDACSATCQFEITELEPNDTPATANTLVPPWHAAIAPVGDVDVVKVDAPLAGTTLSAQVVDHGTGDCAAMKIVSHLDILGVDGTTVLATNDGFPGDYCAFASAPDLPAGTYYVRVTAGPLAVGAGQSFSYGLTIITQ